MVPLVVAKQGARFLLIDGERRYHASKQAGLREVPAFVLTDAEGKDLAEGDLLFRMFQIHHLREQWHAIQQCHALEQTFHKIVRDKTVTSLVDERERFAAITRKLAILTGIDTRTAADRIKFLRWPKSVKDDLYDNPESEDKKGAYSYILEIEDKIILPALANYPEYFEHVPVDGVRIDLLNKLAVSLQNAKEVREVAPYFRTSLSRKADRHRLLKVFTKLHNSPEMTYDEARERLAKEFPGIVVGEPPSPRRLVTLCNQLENACRLFDPGALDQARRRAKAPRSELRDAIVSLQNVLTELAESFAETDR
jgi:hypothetical protein